MWSFIDGGLTHSVLGSRLCSVCTVTCHPRVNVKALEQTDQRWWHVPASHWHTLASCMRCVSAYICTERVLHVSFMGSDNVRHTCKPSIAFSSSIMRDLFVDMRRDNVGTPPGNTFPRKDAGRFHTHVCPRVWLLPLFWHIPTYSHSPIKQENSLQFWNYYTKNQPNTFTLVLAFILLSLSLFCVSIATTLLRISQTFKILFYRFNVVCHWRWKTATNIWHIT